MLKWFMKRRLKAFGDAFDYDTGYMQELVDVDPAAGLAVSRLSAAPPIAPMRPRPPGMRPRSWRR